MRFSRAADIFRPMVLGQRYLGGDMTERDDMDSIFTRWAAAQGLTVQRTNKDAGVLSVLVMSDEGAAFQIWVEQDTDVTVGVMSIDCAARRSLNQTFTTPISELDATLNRALAAIKTA